MPEGKELHRPTILAVGRLERLKGYDLLLTAFSHIAAQYPEWHLTIVDEGPYTIPLGSYVRLWGCTNASTCMVYSTMSPRIILNQTFSCFPPVMKASPTPFVKPWLTGCQSLQLTALAARPRLYRMEKMACWYRSKTPRL
ncbi:hypothetical protein DSUL_60115 [Desulfovibrionales bacterium]